RKDCPRTASCPCLIPGCWEAAHILLGCLCEKPVATRARRANHAQTREEGRVAPMPTPGKLAALAEASLAGAEPAPRAAGAAERAAVAAAEPLEIESLGRRRAHHAHRSWRPRRRLVVGVVHTQAPAAQLEGVEAPDGVGRAGRVRELSEREAARLAGDPVRAEAHAHGRVDVEEHSTQLLFSCLEGQIADEDRGRNGRLLGKTISHDRSSLRRAALPLETGTARQLPPQPSSALKRMLPLRMPSSTTSTPPLRIIHSSRWSRYSRLKSPDSTSCGSISKPRMLSAAAAKAAVTLGRAHTRSSQAARRVPGPGGLPVRSEEHTSELQSRGHLVCRLLLEKKKKKKRVNKNAK